MIYKEQLSEHIAKMEALLKNGSVKEMLQEMQRIKELADRQEETFVSQTKELKCK